ncbi:MAG: hypothetical protein ABR921_17490 [Candidatus Sulfotelmatobacter sp.]
MIGSGVRKLGIGDGQIGGRAQLHHERVDAAIVLRLQRIQRQQVG